MLRPENPAPMNGVQNPIRIPSSENEPMTLKSPITRFGLIRHATTVWNQQKRIQGRTDTPLAPEGIAQSRRWAMELKRHRWSRILSSDSGRAEHTAQILNACLRVPVVSDSRLREQDWGIWTGRTLSEIKNDHPEELEKQESAGWKFCPPGGEDRRQVRLRSRRALIEAAEKWPGQTILVITHEGVIKSLLYRRYLCAGASRPVRVQPCRLHWLIHDGRCLRIGEMNAQALFDPRASKQD